MVKTRHPQRWTPSAKTWFLAISFLPPFRCVGERAILRCCFNLRFWIPIDDSQNQGTLPLFTDGSLPMRAPALTYRNICFLLCLFASLGKSSGAGLNGDIPHQGEIWKMLFSARGLLPALDTDDDGVSNAAESIAGTDPRNAHSVAAISVQRLTNGGVAIAWDSVLGKFYDVLFTDSLRTAIWQTNASFSGTGQRMVSKLSSANSTTPAQFFRLAVRDVDTDGDGLTDWEELQLGFDPASANTSRYSTPDGERVAVLMGGTNLVTISAMDADISERWPDPGLIVIRRRGGVQPLTIRFVVSGSAVRGVDYTLAEGDTITLSAGAREAWIEVWPIADADDTESTETIVMTLLPGEGYQLGSNITAALSLANETETTPPPPKAAARFLLQAAFGPDADAADDADIIPENVEDVMARGFESWIDHQFAQSVGRLQPFFEWAEPRSDSLELWGDLKEWAWWNRVMGASKLRPDATTNAPYDPLRQRVAFALSEIFVVSDRSDDLVSAGLGFVNYYDTILRHTFGNFRDLLHDVTWHPVMGLYLSHLGNKKPDPVKRVYPDENYAREVMQLFSIGLWELHPDGTRRLDEQGQPIPTYNNRNITEFARVFTGMAFGGANTEFGTWPRSFTSPMGAWDEYHDIGAKTLLRGLTLPARTTSPGTNGLATRADVDAAIDNLFQHPNVGPFIGRLLIQRLVTSNPSTGYVARVSAAFANNGLAERGDMKAVIKAILLDREARDPAMLAVPIWGRLREPLLRCVNLGRAFNARSEADFYALDTFFMDHIQEPFKSPSVFNFFLPAYSPPGPITQARGVAPEFQIVNASSVVSAANYFWKAIWGGMHRWGSARPERNVELNLTQEMLLTVPAAYVNDPFPNIEPMDPDPLLRRLDMVLTGGTLSPAQFQVIREHVDRVRYPTWDWPKERVRLAIYLVVNSPEFCIQR